MVLNADGNRTLGGQQLGKIGFAKKRATLICAVKGVATHIGYTCREGRTLLGGKERSACFSDE